jgi:protein arginine N-methyltransferase 3
MNPGGRSPRSPTSPLATESPRKSLHIFTPPDAPRMSNAAADASGPDPRGRRSPSSASTSTASTGDFDDWTSEAGDAPILSLLGAHLLPTADDIWAELKAATGVDVPAFAASRSLGDFDLVRLVNFLRASGPGTHGTGTTTDEVAARLRAALSSESLAPGAPVWTDEKWLQPVVPDDGLIMAVLARGEDGETGDAVEAAKGSGAGTSATSTAPGPAAGGGASGGSAEALRAELAAANAMIRRLLEEREDDGSSGSGSDGEDSDRDGSGSPSSRSSSPDPSRSRRRRRRRAGKGKSGHEGITGADNDTYYFESYASVGIHAEMIRDAVRTDAYRDSLLRNGPALAGKVVLDVGCGTGILSLFAAEAGARAVVALDASRIIEDAKAIIAANGKEGVITCVRGKAESFPLPPAAEGGVDVIVSEWMGYALHYESMLSSVLDVRDRLLKPGGRMMPSHARIFVGALSDCKLWNERVDGWKNVYGYDMRVMSRHAFPEAHVLVEPGEGVVSEGPHSCISAMNMCTMSSADLDIVGAPIRLRVCRDGIKPESEDAPAGEGVSSSSSTVAGTLVPVHGLLIWFDIDFDDAVFPGRPGGAGAGAATGASSAPAKIVADDGEDDAPPLEEDTGDVPVAAPPPSASSSSSSVPFTKVSFSTGPFTTPTHWQQTALLFDKPILAPIGAVITGTMDMVRDPVNPRCYRFASTVCVTEGMPDSIAAASTRRQSTWFMR